jgi:hypothetical protein
MYPSFDAVAGVSIVAIVSVGNFAEMSSEAEVTLFSYWRSSSSWRIR